MSQNHSYSYSSSTSSHYTKDQHGVVHGDTYKTEKVNDDGEVKCKKTHQHLHGDGSKTIHEEVKDHGKKTEHTYSIQHGQKKELTN